jgi:hypothetical protein
MGSDNFHDMRIMMHGVPPAKGKIEMGNFPFALRDLEIAATTCGVPLDSRPSV